jgi:molybdopterin/thiamine biosynthesis adenylyltransferase/ubiquitin-protein ligase
MEQWWERYPEQLEAEQIGLDSLGYTWQIDESAKQSGLLVIHVEIPHEGEKLLLTATYPGSYPYFPPHVILSNKVLPRHQQPVGKNLCLLARDGEEWRPGNDSLAILLRDQLPKLLRVSSTDVTADFVAETEDHIGEPFSSFLIYAPYCAVVVPDGTPPSASSEGLLSIHLRAVLSGWNKEMPFANGIVSTISDLSGRALVAGLPAPPSFPEKHQGYWLRLPARPSSEKTQEHDYFVKLLMSRVPAFNAALNKAKVGKTFILGFVYPDEVSWRSNADDWFFIVVKVEVEAKRSRPVTYKLGFVRADWGGEQAWMRRAPMLKPLRKKKALIIGLGSLGAPLALHLARAGIQALHLIDYDHIQIGNTVRWALGWQYAGFQKACAIANHIQVEYPYTSATWQDMRIGMVNGQFNDYNVIREACEKCDIIVDAAANHRVSHFLSDLAKELGKPYVWLTTTHGTAGGVVGRVLPEWDFGCWHCFQYSLADKSLPLPADIGADEIQPGGCSQATFIGAGINSEEVALLAARLIIATLCSGEADGYPDFAWNVAVGDFTEGERSMAPAWRTYQLGINPACKLCSQDEENLDK